MNRFPSVISPVLRNRISSLIIIAVAFLQFGLTKFGFPGWQCPIFHATGLPCPGCGLSRATSDLFHGDWQSSLRLHIFAPLLLIIFILTMLVTLLPKNYRQRVIAKLENLEIHTGLTFFILISMFLYWAIRLIVAPVEYFMLMNNF